MLATWGTSTGRNPTLDLQFAGATSLDNRITFSRGSQATLFDSTGALVYAKHNLLLQSQDFATTWGASGASVLTNTAVSPSGTTTADSIVEDGTTSAHRVAQIVSADSTLTYTASVFFKASGRTWATILIDDNSGNGCRGFYNLSTGAVGTASNTGTGSGAVQSITSFGDGWYRCVLTGKSSTANSGNIRVLVAGTTGDTVTSYLGTNALTSVFVWGAQLNLPNMEGGVTSSLDTYYPTTTAAYYAPRFDYNPSTLAAQGLLIEEQRTNLALQSEDFATTWTVIGATVSTNATTAPSGTTTADKLQEDTSTGSHLVTQNITFTAASHTASVFAKRAERDFVRVLFFDGTNTFSGFFNLLNGTVGTLTGTGTTATIAAVGNGWYRCTVTATTAAGSGSFAPRIALADNNSSYTGVTGSGIFLWGAQLEAGAFPTSYIPTTTTALTRSADVASMTGTNFSSWFNAVEGTLLVRCSLPANPPVSPAAGSFPRISSINDNLDDNNIEMFLDGSSPFYVRSRVRSGAVNQAIGNGTTGLSLNTQFSSAIAYKINDFAASDRGLLSWTDTSGTIPTVNKLGIGNQKSDLYLNGYIQRISYYPVRLPNSTLQALTA